MRVPLTFLPIFCAAVPPAVPPQDGDDAGLLQATNFVIRMAEVDANGAPKVAKDSRAQVYDDGLAHVAVDFDGEAKSEANIVLLEEEDLEEDDDNAAVNETVSYQSRAYVPGNPGAPWTKEEILQVKAKLYRFFSPHEFSRVIHEMFPEGHPYNKGDLWRDGPSPAKMLRLVFHDCLRYADGTGGCDGCIHWDGMFARYVEPAYGGDGHEVPPTHTDNNGLSGTVFSLERLYTEVDFPKNTPVMALSLRDAGKSRADLWAFAALMAVEFTIDMNNHACDGLDYPYKYQTCMRFDGEPQCKVVKQREFEFRTGRADCVTEEDAAYKSPKKEDQPWAEADGVHTAQWMKDTFGFNGRESIAAFGAHTLGRNHYPHSLFRYTWTPRQGNIFNNQYYRNIVGKPDWFFEADDPDCTRIGTAYGEPPTFRWVPHVRGDTATGGPVQWIGEKHVCPNCHRDVDDPCCADRPAGTYCHPDNNREPGSIPLEADDDFNRGCEAFRFVNGLDETAIPAEMGLYLGFQVTPEGYPFGCEGLEHFNPEGWGSVVASEMHSWMTWSRIDQVKTEPICPKNTMKDPEDTLEYHQIFELYADDQTAWIADFMPALEKMVAAGYGHENLALSGVDVSDASIVCPHQDPDDTQNQDWICWSAADLSEEFHLVSKIDGRVLQMDETTHATEVATMAENDARQLWRLTGDGKFFINSATNRNLKFFWESHSNPSCSHFEWRPVEGGGQYDGSIICADTLWSCEKALDRGFEQVDGPIALHKFNQHPGQQWEMVGNGRESVLGPPRGEFDRSAVCADAIALDLSRVVTNNIQTRGPKHDDPPVMRFDRVTEFEGRHIDLVISVNSCGNNYIYHPIRSDFNGPVYEGMIQLNLVANTATTFRFTFVESGTDIKVTLPMVAFTVHDFDEGRGGRNREQVSVCGAAATALDPNTQILEERHPPADAQLANTFAGTDCVKWSSQLKGNKRDDVKSINVESWDDDDKKRAASFVMINKAEFDFSYALSAGAGGRNVVFSGTAGVFCLE